MVARRGRGGIVIDTGVKFVAIVGPTATGKTGLAISLAELFDGEVVCADSRTIYRGMDIGTAKPTAAEQALVPHHMLDIMDPGERLSAGEFKKLAESVINEIAGRGKLPLLVGGSGLYVDAVIFDYKFPAAGDPQRRQRLEAMTDAQLHELLLAKDPEAFDYVDRANRRRVIRAIETVGEARQRRSEVRPEVLVLGTTLNKEVVQKRIEHRIDKMLGEGFIDEVRVIGETYGWDSSALDVMGYRPFKGLLLGTKTLEQAKTECMYEHLSLFKKQVTWFKRNQSIHWVANADEAVPLVRVFLHETKISAEN